MEPIEIIEENREIIEAALAEVNGGAKKHAYTTFEDVLKVVSDAEALLSRLLRSPTIAAHVRYRATSGKCRVSRSARDVTTITVEKWSSVWMLTFVFGETAYQTPMAPGLTITPRMILMDERWTLCHG